MARPGQRQNSPASALPPEIIMEIHKYLLTAQTAAQSLKTCRLVNHDWERVATPLLFASISVDVTNTESMQKLQKVADVSLSSVVKTVRFQATDRDPAQDTDNSAIEDLEVRSAIHITSAALQKLVNVHTVFFRGPAVPASSVGIRRYMFFRCWKQILYGGLPPNTSHLDLDAAAAKVFDACVPAVGMSIPRLVRLQTNMTRITHLTLFEYKKHDEKLASHSCEVIAPYLTALKVLKLCGFGGKLLDHHSNHPDLLGDLKCKELVIEQASFTATAFALKFGQLLARVANTLETLSLSNVVVYRTTLEGKTTQDAVYVNIFSCIAQTCPKLTTLRLRNFEIKREEECYSGADPVQTAQGDSVQMEEGTSRVELADEQNLANLRKSIRVIKEGKWVIKD